MIQVGELELTEVGVEAAAGLGEILKRSVGAENVARYVEDEPLAWSVFEDGGWDLLGVPQSRDGAGASLRDLVEVAKVWGESIVPSPLMTTILSKRWSEAARECGGPVTVSVRTRASGRRGVAPFGGTQGVSTLAHAHVQGDVLTLANPVLDDFVPSLRLVESDTVTSWEPKFADELRVVWAAEASGCASRMLRDAISYVKQREQFGQPIGRFQAMKHNLANAHLLAEEAETAVILASLVPERAQSASTFAFDASLRVIEIAVQAHGGLGFTWEMGLHMFMRHVIALRELAEGLN